MKWLEQRQPDVRQLTYSEVVGTDATKLAAIAKKLMVRRTSIVKDGRRVPRAEENLVLAVNGEPGLYVGWHCLHF